MALIQNLDISIRANTSKFDRRLGKSMTTFGKFQSVVESGGVAAFNAFGIAAAAGMAGVTAAIGTATVAATKLAENINDLNQGIKDFERFGLDASESFGEFRVIAKKAGLEVEDLVDVTKDLGIRIGEAIKDGEGEQFELFKRLGLDIHALNRMRPEDQLRTYMDALSRIKNETEKLTIADIQLSDAGTKVIKAFSGGAKSFDDAKQKADELGLSLDDIDVANIEIASETMGEMGLVFDGIITQLTAELSPAVTAFLETFSGVGSEISETENLMDQLATVAVVSLGAIGDGVNIVAGSFGKFRLGVLQTMREMASFTTQFAALTGAKGPQKEFSKFTKFLDVEVARQSKLAGRFEAGLAGEFSSEMMANLDAARQRALDRVDASTPRDNPLAFITGGAAGQAIRGDEKTTAAIDKMRAESKSNTDKLIQAINKSGGVNGILIPIG